jgi:hypothetical protein
VRILFGVVIQLHVEKHKNELLRRRSDPGIQKLIGNSNYAIATQAKNIPLPNHVFRASSESLPSHTQHNQKTLHCQTPEISIVRIP